MIGKQITLAVTANSCPVTYCMYCIQDLIVPHIRKWDKSINKLFKNNEFALIAYFMSHQ